MKFISWFSGIGGFDLALARAGHKCVGACEIDPFARKVYERRLSVAVPVVEWIARRLRP